MPMPLPRSQTPEVLTSRLVGLPQASLHVRDAEAGKWSRWVQFDSANRSGNLPPKQPPLPVTMACRHKFALSLQGFGYSSRLRTLLLCGALVIHVQHDDNEFYLPALVPGKHLVVLRGRDAITSQLLPTLERLRANPSRSEQIASAGQRFARRWLTHERVVGYVSTLLRGYAARFHGEVSLSPQYLRLTDEADVLQRATGLCHCVSRKQRKEMSADAFRTMHQQSSICMQQGQGQRCRPWAPKGGSRCFAPMCCVGWDCGSRPLGCPKSKAHDPGKV